MSPVRVALALAAWSAAAYAALKPIESELRPSNGKAAIVYKTTAQGELKIDLYFPRDWRSSGRRPAIVFFFGGSCATGSPAQFAATAEYFASRGMVAASAEYRIASLHHTGPRECVEDAKSAIRWLRMNAPRLGLDPRRIAAGGGSSGATIAAFAAYNTTVQPEDERGAISCRPDALLLINPALGFGSSGKLTPEQKQAALGPLGAFIADWKVVGGGPPAILFFGTEDPLQDKAREFARQLIGAGARAEFFTAAGQQHAFYNRHPDSAWHALVLRQMDLFLASLGYLKGEPRVAIPAGATEALRREP
jgi:acetyl esterase